MSQPPVQSFKVYRIDSNVFAHPGYAICSAFRNPGRYLKAESFVLVKSSDEDGKSFGSKISFPSDDKDMPITIDEAFAADEALRQAEVDFSVQMHDRNFSLSSPHPWPKKMFAEIPQHRLVSVWAYTPLKDALSRVGDATSCELLANYINSLRALPTFSRSQLAL